MVLTCVQRLSGISWTHYMPSNVPPPSVLLNRPLCATVSGLGFQKLDFCDVSFCTYLANRQNFEVRFPKVERIYTPEERPADHGASM